MSGRHRTAAQSAVRSGKIAGAGVAGLTMVFAVAPLAQAHPGTDKPSPSGSKSAPATAAKKPVPKSAARDSTKKAAVIGFFGQQKIRVGVQIKDGSVVPPDTTTTGSVIQIKETGPNAQDAATFYGGTYDSGTSTSTLPCTTIADTAPSGHPTETICEFPDPNNFTLRSAAKSPGAGVSPALASDPLIDHYTVFPEDSATFTQKSVKSSNLLIDTVVQSVPACDPGFKRSSAKVDAPPPPCPESGTTQDVVFNDPGRPPLAKNDSKTTPFNTPVDVDELHNDTTHGVPVKSVEITSDPSHGTAKVLAGSPVKTSQGESGPSFRYTPNADFVGVDHFRYRLGNGNGFSTATVTITVQAAPTTPAPSSSSGAGANLANTGTNSLQLVDLAALLLVGGAATTAIARRRRPLARHARDE